MMTPKTYSWLPSELIAHILSLLWSSPLSNDTRISLHYTLPLVSYTFFSLFKKTSFLDVHLLSPAHGQHLLRVLRDESPLYSASFASRCRSIQCDVTTDELAQAFDATLYAIDTLAYLPNLRELAVTYPLVSSAVIESLRYIRIPPSVAEYTLSYSSLGPPLSMIVPVPEFATHVHWTVRDVQRLVEAGVGAGAYVNAVAEMIRTFPSARTLEVDATSVPLVEGSTSKFMHTMEFRMRNYPFKGKEGADVSITAVVGDQVIHAECLTLEQGDGEKSTRVKDS